MSISLKRESPYVQKSSTTLQFVSEISDLVLPDVFEESPDSYSDIAADDYCQRIIKNISLNYSSNMNILI